FLTDDLVHRDAGEILAMPDGALVLLLALELEHQRLVAASVRDDGAPDSRVLSVRAGLHGIAVDHCQHAVELNFGSHVARQRFDLDGHAFTASPSTTASTRLNSTSAPTSPASVSISTASPVVTRYCFPP